MAGSIKFLSKLARFFSFRSKVRITIVKNVAWYIRYIIETVISWFQFLISICFSCLVYLRIQQCHILPNLNTAAILALNIMYWLTVLSSRKTSLFCIVCIIFFFCQSWINQSWKDAKGVVFSEKSETQLPAVETDEEVPKLGHYVFTIWYKFGYAWRWLWKLRQTHHGLFALLMCMILGVLAFIGHYISDVVIIYTFLLTVFIGPDIMIYALPESLYVHLDGFMTAEGLNPSQIAYKNAMIKKSIESELEDFLSEEMVEHIAEFSIQEEQEKLDTNGERNLTVIQECGLEHLINEDEEKLLYHGMEEFPNLEDEVESDAEMEVVPSQEICPKAEVDKLKRTSPFFAIESSDSENEELFSCGLSFNDVSNEEDISLSRFLPVQQAANILSAAVFHNVQQEKQISFNGLQEAVIKSSDKLIGSLSHFSDDDMEDYEILSEFDLNS